jgi:hypothetical protein
MMIRNTYQIWGSDLRTKSSFVVCWTPNGHLIGETAQAIRLANNINIPIYNFGCSSTIEMAGNILRKLDELYA